MWRMWPMGRMADGIEIGGRNALAVSYQSGPEKQKTIVSMSINGGQMNVLNGNGDQFAR